MMIHRSCEECVDGQRVEGDIHMRKKGKHRQRAGIMVSIYRKRAKRRT